MTYRDVKALSLREQIQLKFAKRTAKLVNVFQCLIVSADASRRETFERAASEGGWKTFPCADPGSALAYLSRSVVQLAVVDLEAQQTNLFRPVVERLAASNGLLLIVCGNEADVEEEVWVRQSGAWLYLPGAVEGTQFRVLCGEARQIAERLWKANGLERGLGQPAVTHQPHA